MDKLKLKNLWFLCKGPLISIIIGIIPVCFGLQLEENQLIAISTGGLLTFSLTSGVLILTMPRSQNIFLKKIDSDKRIFGYIIILSTPGILAILAAIFSGLTKPTISNSCLIDASQCFFWAAILTLLRALYILRQLINRANQSGRIPHSQN